MDYDLCQEIGCEVDLCPDITVEVDSPWNHFQLCFSETDLLTCCEHSQLSPQSELSVEPEDEDEEDDDLSAASTSSRSPSPTAKRKMAPLSKQEKLEKNERERVRIEAKGEALLSLKTLVTESGLIDDCEKKQRFTEECTLKLTVQLIDRLKREISSYSGRPSRVPQPLARKVTNRKVKKTPNRFLLFSQAMRPSFLYILKTYRYPGKTDAELVTIQVDNREVTRFLSAVWRSLDTVEKSQNWKELAEEDKSYFTKLACRMIEAE